MGEQVAARINKKINLFQIDLIINTDTSESSGLNTALGIEGLCQPNQQGSAVMITGFTSDLRSDLLIWF